MNHGERGAIGRPVFENERGEKWIIGKCRSGRAIQDMWTYFVGLKKLLEDVMLASKPVECERWSTGNNEMDYSKVGPLRAHGGS